MNVSDTSVILRQCLALNPASLAPLTTVEQNIAQAQVRRWGRLHRYNDFVVRTVIEVDSGSLFIVSTTNQDDAVAKKMRAAARMRKYQPMGGAARSRSDFIQWEI